MSRKSIYEGQFSQGQIIGQWTVLSPQIYMWEKGRAQVKCRCICDTEHYVSCAHLSKGKSTQCSDCSQKNRAGQDNPNWRGTGDVSQTYLTKLSASVSNGGSISNFTITPSYINSLYEDSGKLCTLTSQPISFVTNTAAVVPLNPELGYVQGNVAVVHSNIAPILRKTSANSFIARCLEVAQQHQFKN